MGRKINPILFRLGFLKRKPSSIVLSPLRKPHFSPFFIQEVEYKKFLFLLLRSRGVLVRKCVIFRTSEKLSVSLDLYFTSLFLKDSKLSWVRSTFKNMKKKYISLKKVKDVKIFLDGTSDLGSEKQNGKRISYVKNKKNSCFRSLFKRSIFSSPKMKKVKNYQFVYKRRLFYFLGYKNKKDVIANADEGQSVYSIRQNHYKSDVDVVRLNVGKLSKFFGLRKVRYNYSSFLFKNLLSLQKRGNQNLLELNRFLCRSLQDYSGIEEVKITLSSTQLSFLPTMKLFKKTLMKQLFLFRRNRNIKKYFLETLELFYFVLGSFGNGNASLLAKFLSYLLEKNRKQLLLIRFLKKSIQTFYKKFPQSFFAVEGIRILMKGRFNKRRRTKKILISEGEISLQTLDTSVDYYQTKAITIYGCFGIKVWISKRKM